MKSDKIFQTKAKVIKNIEVAPNYYKMVLDAPGIAKEAQPGQFVNVRVSEKYEPLLRRPFSIHRIRNHKPETRGQIEILYEVIGKGTKILSQKKPGDKIDILGPLGNGFDLNFKYSIANAILVAGGMGVAPLVFLSEKLAEIKNQKFLPCRQAGKIKNLVLIGAKTKNQILCEKEFKRLDYEIKISTDDGSRGFKGLVSELLKKTLSTISHRTSTIYACGPKAMLKEIANISKRYKIPTQVSLEEHMACGIGACYGCVVKTNHGYKRVCKEGPVFNIRDIKF